MMTKSLGQIVATIDKYYWRSGRKVQLHGAYSSGIVPKMTIYLWLNYAAGRWYDRLELWGFVGGEMGRGESTMVKWLHKSLNYYSGPKNPSST